jgi:hypothetical protein
MDTIIKSFVLPVLVGIFMFAFGAWFSAGNQEVVEAKLESMEVLATPGNLLKSESIELIKKLEETSQVDGILNALQRSRVRLGLYELTLSNNSKQRSKEIVVSFLRPWFSWMYRSGPGSASLTRVKFENSAFMLDSVNPGDSVRIYIIADYSSFGPDVRVLHDGKRLEIVSLAYDSRNDAFGLIEKALRNPGFYSFAIILGFMMTLWMSVGLILEIYKFFSPHFRARMTSKETLADWMKFLEFVKTNFPDKFDAAALKTKPEKKID